jgi:hypothetical protein
METESTDDKSTVTESAGRSLTMTESAVRVSVAGATAALSVPAYASTDSGRGMRACMLKCTCPLAPGWERAV